MGHGFNVTTLTYHQNQGAYQAPFMNPQFSNTQGIPFVHSGPINVPESVGKVVTNFLPSLPETNKPPGMGLITGTVKAFVKDELPPVMKTVGTVGSAVIVADKLVGNIQKALDQGESKEEAYTCETVKTLSEEMSGKVLKGMVVNGIPAYVETATMYPPLALTVPIVATLIPQAYQGAQNVSKVIGEGMGSLCHHGFDLAKKMTKKEE